MYVLMISMCVYVVHNAKRKECVVVGVFPASRLFWIRFILNYFDLSAHKKKQIPFAT